MVISPPADADRGEERGGLDAIGDHRVLDRLQLLDAFDLDRRRARADDLRAHAVEERREVGDLGLAGRVVDDGRALGQHGGHEDVLGRADARELEQDAGADQLVGPGLDVAVADREASRRVASRPATCMSIGPGPEVVAAGQGDPGLAESSEQRAEHHDRCPHALDELVGRLGHDLVVAGHVDGQLVAPMRSTSTPIASSSSLMRSTSVMRGHVAQHVAARRPAGVAAISLSTEFLAPLMGTAARQRAALLRTTMRSRTT